MTAAGRAFLFAPGAGAPSSSAWMQAMMRRFETLGRVECFDYAYQRAGRRSPDRHPVLVKAHDEALAALEASHAGPVVLVGKSMGGRIGCHVAVSRPKPPVALGMPPFGVFAGFMGMMLSPGFMPTAAFAVVVVVWFSASWYCIDLLQQVIFGRGRPDLRYEDLHRAESAALVTIVLLLLALGLAPPRFFQPGTASFPDAVATKAVTWP